MVGYLLNPVPLSTCDTQPTGIVRNVGQHYFAPLVPGGPLAPHWNISGVVPGLNASVVFAGAVLSKVPSLVNPSMSVPDLYLNVTNAWGGEPSQGPVVSINRASTDLGLGPTDASCCTRAGETFEIPYTAYYVFYVPSF